MLTALFLAESRYLPRVPANTSPAPEAGRSRRPNTRTTWNLWPGCAPATPGSLQNRGFELENGRGTGHYLNRPAAPNACLLEILREALMAGVLAIVKKF